MKRQSICKGLAYRVIALLAALMGASSITCAPKTIPSARIPTAITTASQPRFSLSDLDSYPPFRRPIYEAEQVRRATGQYPEKLENLSEGWTYFRSGKGYTLKGQIKNRKIIAVPVTENRRSRPEVEVGIINAETNLKSSTTWVYSDISDTPPDTLSTAPSTRPYSDYTPDTKPGNLEKKTNE